MRRALSSLLVAIFGFLAAAPAILADDASNVPACCRRFGKHRCLLLLEESGGPALKGVCSNYVQRAPVAVSPETPGVSAANGTAGAPDLTHTSVVAQPVALAQSRLSSTRFSRGPPA